MPDCLETPKTRDACSNGNSNSGIFITPIAGWFATGAMEIENSEFKIENSACDGWKLKTKN